MFKINFLLLFIASFMVSMEGSFAQENCLELFQKNISYTDPFSSEFANINITKENVNDLLLEDYGFIDTPLFVHMDAIRAKRMTELAKSVIENRKSNEAVIVFNGVYHSYDLHAALGNRSDISYSTAKPGTIDEHPFADFLRTHFKFTDFSKEETQEFVNFLELVVPSFGAAAHKTNFMHIVSDTLQKTALEANADIEPTYFVVQMQLPIMLAAAQRQGLNQLSYHRPVSPRVWVMGDWHFTAGINFMTSLPTVEELKAQGLTEVTLLLEGYPNGQPVELELAQFIAKRKLAELAVNNLTDNQMVHFGKFLNSTPRLRKLRDAVLNEFVIFHPAYSYLIDRVSSYENQGIKLKIIGMH